MSNDPADAAAKALVAYWRREEMDAAQRQLCSRLAQALDAPARAALADTARADPEGSIPGVARALRDAAADDWMTGTLLRAFAPASAGVQVHVAGNGNTTTVAGRDLIISGTDRRSDDEIPARDSILVAAAGPADLTELRLGVEAREIQETVRQGSRREGWNVHLYFSVRLQDLTRGLVEDTPRILHFCGHGNEEEGLFLEDGDGRAHPLSKERLQALFAALPLKPECVLLNSCFSESQACAISRHVDYVIGTDGEVPDDAAILFSRGFYQAIAAGWSVPQAYEMGCVQWQDAEYADYPRPRLIRRGDPC